MNILCKNSQLVVSFEKSINRGALRISDHHGRIVGFYRLYHDKLFRFKLDIPCGIYQVIIETDYYRDEKYLSVAS